MKTRKLLVIGTFAVILALVFASCGGDNGGVIPAHTPGLLFTLIDNDTAYSVSRGTATAAEVIIPAVYNGLPVTEIGNSGFETYTAMTSVFIPDSVTSIGARAFAECFSLTSITIPDSVTSIGGSAFSSCVGLESITVNSGNTVYRSEGNCLIEISSNTLIRGCKNSVMPSSVTSIGEYAFSRITGLTSIIIPDSVTSIGWGAFSGCTGLTSITISNSVTNIGGAAFYGCTGLTSITIPDSVTSIEQMAFNNCTGLTNISIPDSVTWIGPSAFCADFESITVDSGNTVYRSEGNCIIQISNNALIHGCKNSIIPDSVTSIGFAAFINCTGLTSIIIPDSVTNIGSNAFNGCWRLTSVTLGTITEADFHTNTFPGNLRDVYFADGGGAGTYTTTNPGNSATWTKQ